MPGEKGACQQHKSALFTATFNALFCTSLALLTEEIKTDQTSVTPVASVCYLEAAPETCLALKLLLCSR